MSGDIVGPPVSGDAVGWTTCVLGHCGATCVRCILEAATKYGYCSCGDVPKCVPLTESLSLSHGKHLPGASPLQEGAVIAHCFDPVCLTSSLNRVCQSEGESNCFKRSVGGACWGMKHKLKSAHVPRLSLLRA